MDWVEADMVFISNEPEKTSAHRWEIGAAREVTDTQVSDDLRIGRIVSLNGSQVIALLRSTTKGEDNPANLQIGGLVKMGTAEFSSSWRESGDGEERLKVVIDRWRPGPAGPRLPSSE